MTKDTLKATQAIIAFIACVLPVVAWVLEQGRLDDAIDAALTQEPKS